MAGDLADLVTQPYDKIPPDLKEEYASRSAYNVVRLIRGEASPDDEGWHSDAAELLEEWRSGGILAQDEEEGYYLYTQTFTTPTGESRTRRGVVGAFDLAHRDRVFHHERTHAHVRGDRRRLLDATGVHAGQLFILRHEGPPVPESVFETAELLGEVVEEDGTRHCFSRLNHQESVAQIREAHADSRYVIADGHHRFTVACDYADDSDHEGSSRVMVTVVDADDPGLVVLPTHRVLRDLPELRSRNLSQMIQAIGGRPFPMTDDAQPFVDEVRNAGEHTLGVLVRGGAFLLTFGESEFDPEAGAVGRLDTAVLDGAILRPLLKDLELEKHLVYHRSPQAAVEDVRSGEADVAFILNAIEPLRVAEIAADGGVMPPKSTDFFPKMLTGFTFLDTRS